MRCNRRPSSHPQSKAGGVWIAALAWHCREGTDRDGEERRRVDLSNAKTHWCFNKDIVHLMFACRQNRCCKQTCHDVCCADTPHIPNDSFFFVQPCPCVFPPRTPRHGCKEQVEEELLPNAEGYLHLQRAMSRAPHLILEHPFPRPALHHSLDDAQKGTRRGEAKW